MVEVKNTYTKKIIQTLFLLLCSCQFQNQNVNKQSAIKVPMSCNSFHMLNCNLVFLQKQKSLVCIQTFFKLLLFFILYIILIIKNTTSLENKQLQQTQPYLFLRFCYSY